MPKSHLRLDTRRQLNDGTYPVQVAVGHGTGLYLSTGIYLTPDEWNERAQTATGRNGRRVNSALSAILARVELRVLDLRERGLWDKFTPDQLRRMLRDLNLDSPDAPAAITLEEAFGRVIAMKSRSTAATYRQGLTSLRDFCDTSATDLGSIDRPWLDAYYRSLSRLSVNSRAFHMGKLNSVINWAIDSGLSDNHVFRGYRVPTEETRMRCLPVDVMRRLLTMPLEGREAAARDLFALSFYLIGMNVADMAALTPDSIRDGRVEYRRAKTGKLYSIRLEPEAAEIIGRHRGGRKLLAPFDECTPENYTAAFAWINKALKHIGVYPGLTTYYARYSWATFAASLDIPKDTISESMGHSHGAHVTGIYIQFSRDKIDAANRKVIDYALLG